MRTARLGLLIICGMLVWSRPASAVLVEKILAVVNGEILTLQDFEDHLALRTIYQTDTVDVDRQRAVQRFVDQALLRQEALRTRIVQVGEDEVSQHLRELGQQPDRGQELVRVMQERGYHGMMCAPGSATSLSCATSSTDGYGSSSASQKVRSCNIIRSTNRRSESPWMRLSASKFGAYWPNTKSTFDSPNCSGSSVRKGTSISHPNLRPFRAHQAG